MRKLTVIVLVLIIPLLATLLVLGQSGKLPTTNKNGAPFGNGKAAILQTVKDSHDPSRFTYTRLYCTPDGNSHFQNVTVELPAIDFAPPADPIHIGGAVAASSAFFGGFEAGWGTEDLESQLYHPAPAAQFIVVLQGDFSVIATDGETRQLRPGGVIRVEDTPPCKGHITVAGDRPGFFLFAR